MRHLAKPKRVALTAGAGVMLVFVVCGAFWNDLAVQYYLWELHEEPDRLFETIREPESTPQGVAVRRFVSTHKGSLVLARAYASKILGAFPRHRSFPSRLESAEALMMGLYKAKEPGDVWRAWYRGARDGGDGIRRDLELVTIYELLGRSGYRELGEFTVSEHPDLRFRLLPGDEAFLASGITRNDGSVPNESEILLLVRRVRGAGEVDWVSTCVLPLLFRALKEADERKRALAQETLQAAGYDWENPVPQLLALLSDPTNRCSGNTNYPWLCRSTGERSWFCWTPAARALIELGIKAIPGLVEALEGDGWRESGNPELARVFEEILRARQDRDSTGRSPTRRLEELTRNISAFRKMWRSDDWEARDLGRRALDLMKQHYATGSSELIAALEHDDRDVRLFAAELIADKPGLAAKAFPQLVSLAADDDPKIRYWTAVGLVNSQRAAGELELVLEALLNDDVDWVREVAREGLEHIERRER